MIVICGRLIKSFGAEYSAARQRTCLGSRGPQVQILLFRPLKCGNSSVGRASAFQAECREFEPRFPLQLFMRHQLSWQSTRLLIVLSQVQILYDAPFICICSSAGQSNALLRRGSGVRIPPDTPYTWIHSSVWSEHSAHNRVVAGSSPAGSTIFFVKMPRSFSGQDIRFSLWKQGFNSPTGYHGRLS